MRTCRLGIVIGCIFIFSWSAIANATSGLNVYVRFEEISAQTHPPFQVLYSNFVQESSLYTNSGFGYETSNGEALSVSIGESNISNIYGGTATVADDYNYDLGSIFNADVHLSTGNSIDNTSIANVGFNSEVYGSMVGYEPYIDPYLNVSAGDCGGLGELFHFDYYTDSFDSLMFISAYGSSYLENVTQGIWGSYDWSIYGFGSTDEMNYIVGVDFNEDGSVWTWGGIDPMYLKYDQIAAMPRFIDFEVADGDIFHYTASFNLTAGLIENHPVPEPATILLFGSGFLGLAGAARKKLKK